MNTLDPIAIQDVVKAYPKFKPKHLTKALSLLITEKCSVPFVARYRKEATGGLEDMTLLEALETYNKSLEKESRRVFVLEAIKKLDKLTPDLEKKIKLAKTLAQIEDLYSPYKSKQKTKAQLAEEAGLKPLAKIIKTTAMTLKEVEAKYGKDFINKEKKINEFKDALDGVTAILSEEISHTTEIKDELRNLYWEEALITSELRKDGDKIENHHKYKDYFEFQQKVSDIKNPKNSYRYLALRRGSLEKILRVDIVYDKERALNFIRSKAYPNIDQLGCKDFIEKAIQKAYVIALHTSLSVEIKSELKSFSDESAISIFGRNLKNLLLQPYLGQKSVLGIDPGVRTGCKTVIIDKNGNFLFDTVIYPHPPKNDVAGSINAIKVLIERFDIKYIAIGNGTYGKETLSLLQKNIDLISSGKVKAMLVNEDGASIYSASAIAREEFPDRDVTVRGAVSIARRFQDPLAELVKIDPKSIGVGQYQHDVNQVQLKKSLNSVVESCVNYVGVDLNTASAPLLSFVSGIGAGLAKNIVKKREELKGFKTRTQLMDVSRFSEKTFEQSAGFLRVYNGENPLDGTFIHPEKYTVLEKWCADKKVSLKDLISDAKLISEFEKDKANKAKLGDFTHTDIVSSLKAPSQDPRTEFKAFEFRNDIESLSDLKVGQYYPGLITNITQFGAFVDVGLKENGLIHISQMSDKFVEDPLSVLKVGQEVKARLIEVDLERKRIAFSLKSEDSKTRVNASAPGQKRKKRNRNSTPSFSESSNPFSALKGLKL